MLMKKICCFFLLSGFAILSVNVFAQSTCRSAYDSNFNNDYQGTSYFPGPMTVPLNTPFNGAIEISNDVDYYRFYITTSGTIKLSLLNLPANYNLKLVNDLGYSIATSANSGTANEVITFAVTGGKFYYALVYPANKRTFTATACYTLNIATITATRMMAPGTDVYSQKTDDIRLYPNPASGSVNLELQDVEGTVRITIMNLLGEKIFDQFSEQKNLRIDLSALQAGLYLVNVIGVNGTVIREKLILK
ncbi:MAG: T9SS type A sorting domain-containing protein [Bacteroidota bacterium]